MVWIAVNVTVPKQSNMASAKASNVGFARIAVYSQQGTMRLSRMKKG